MKVSLFTAQWCSACSTVKQALNAINTEDLEIEVLDVDTLGMQALSKVGIKGIPSLILYDNQGNEIKRKSGALTKKQLEVFLGLDQLDCSAVSAKQLDKVRKTSRMKASTTKKGKTCLTKKIRNISPTWVMT